MWMPRRVFLSMVPAGEGLHEMEGLRMLQNAM